MLIKNWRSTFAATQKSFAAKLSSYESKFSAKKRTLILVLFCFLFGIASIYVIIATVTKSFSSTDVPVTPINIPYHIGKNFNQPGAMIDGETYQRVEHFKHYLDSLRINNPGRFAEIMNTRPHLMDSILTFEKMYLLQLKK
jgi:hypothetical protein